MEDDLGRGRGGFSAWEVQGAEGAAKRRVSRQGGGRPREPFEIGLLGIWVGGWALGRDS